MANDSTQLSELSRDMDRALGGARTGGILVILLSVVSIGIIGYWLNHAHREFIKVTPEFAVNYGVAQVQTAIPTLTPRLTQQAIDAAPGIFDDAEERLGQIPDQFATMLMTRTSEELDKLLPQVEEELYESLKVALAKAEAQRGPGVTDEAQIKALITVLADTYAQESINLVAELKSRYTRTGGDVLAYLEFLADNKGLDKEQELQRQALVTFLTIAARAQANQGT